MPPGFFSLYERSNRKLLHQKIDPLDIPGYFGWRYPLLRCLLWYFAELGRG